MSIKPARADVARATEAARARALLANIKPLAAWMGREKPSPCRARIALTVAREVLKTAALPPAEEARVAAALELDAATALVETNNVAA